MRFLNKLWWDFRTSSYGYYYFIFKEWLNTLIYCRSNKKLLEELDYKLSCVLNMTTDTLSKTNYPLETMYSEIALYQRRIIDEELGEYDAEVQEDMNYFIDLADVANQRILAIKDAFEKYEKRKIKKDRLKSIIESTPYDKIT